MSHLDKLCSLRDVVLTWALQNGFAPCAYFWVGATAEVPTLDLLFSKLAALEYLLVDHGGVVDIRGLGNCGVEFTPTRMPCECAIVQVHVRGAPECSLCDKAWAAHMRACVQQFAC